MEYTWMLTVSKICVYFTIWLYILRRVNDELFAVVDGLGLTDYTLSPKVYMES